MNESRIFGVLNHILQDTKRKLFKALNIGTVLEKAWRTESLNMDHWWNHIKRQFPTYCYLFWQKDVRTTLRSNPNVCCEATTTYRVYWHQSHCHLVTLITYVTLLNPTSHSPLAAYSDHISLWEAAELPPAHQFSWGTWVHLLRGQVGSHQLAANRQKTVRFTWHSLNCKQH